MGGVRQSSRERILTTFSHQKPDRCVTYIWINDEVMEKLMGYMRFNSPEEVEEGLGIDKWKSVGPKITMSDDCRERINSLIPSEYKDDKEYYITSEGRVVRVYKGANYLENTVWHHLGNIDAVEDLDVYPFPSQNG